MNKTYKYTLSAGEKKEITFGVGVNRLAISNANGYDGDVTIVTREITKTKSGDIVSFDDGADAPFADLKVNIEAVQSGSGDPSPTNVRPISGWTGANVQRTGKNLWNTHPYIGAPYNADVGTVLTLRDSLNPIIVNNNIITYDVVSWESKNFKTAPLKAGTYHVHVDLTTITNPRLTLYVVDSSNTVVDKYNTTSASIINHDFTVGDENYIVVYAGSSTAQTLTISNYQIESGTEYTFFANYIGTTYSITWEDEAGTVYGGTLDVKAGVLTVTHANIASYDGETINEPWISSMDKYVAGATPTTGAQVVYPLTTPVTYHLTPTEIRSLLGTNNVWADCGSVNVRYFVQSTQSMIDYIDDKTPVFFDAVEDLGTYDVSLVGATSTDIKNYLLSHKNANIVIRVKRYSTIMLYYLREYSPNYFAEFATHAVIFDAEGKKSMRIDYLRLDLTQETADFTDDYIILPSA